MVHMAVKLTGKKAVLDMVHTADKLTGNKTDPDILQTIQHFDVRFSSNNHAQILSGTVIVEKNMLCL